MSFLNNIIQRHTNPANQVQPRLKGVFEQENNPATDLQEVISENESTINVMPADKPQSLFSQENESKVPIPSMLRGEHEVTAESIEGSDGEVIRNESQQPSDENRFSDLHFVESVKNDVSLDKEPFESNFISAKKELANQSFRNDDEQKVLKSEKADFQSASTNIIPVSATVARGEETPVGHEINPATEFHVSQNKPSINTLNWVRDIKHFINAEAKEKVESPAPVIKVNIGRIDVRAIGQQTPVKTKADSNPVMTLDDFLKKKKDIV
ncbi:MAG: hypothetical protein ABI594_02315 [Ginsengibacter sp.]